MLSGKRDPEENLPQGRCPQSRDKAAAAVGVSGKMIDFAEKVETQGTRIADLEKGRPINPPIGGLIAQDQAAEMLNVGERTVQRARVVQDKGTEDLIASVDRGEVSVSAAAAGGG